MCSGELRPNSLLFVRRWNLTRLNDSKRLILVFIAVAYAQSLALSLVIGLTGGHGSKWRLLGYVSMLVPAISAFVANAVARDRRPILWNRFPVRYLPLALFLMPLVLHAVMLPTAAALGRVQWQDWLKSSDGLYHSPDALGWGVLTSLGLAGRIAMNAIAGVIVVSILALFEEIGWRGWLLPRLVELAGRRRAVVICSVVWAAWHIPYVLAGIQYFDGVPTSWAVWPYRLESSVPV